jgi:hypothetical protein
MILLGCLKNNRLLQTPRGKNKVILMPGYSKSKTRAFKHLCMVVYGIFKGQSAKITSGSCSSHKNTHMQKFSNFHNRYFANRHDGDRTCAFRLVFSALDH